MRKQKVVSVSEHGLIGIRIMAAKMGVSTRIIVERILDAVGGDLNLQEMIMELSGNDLNLKENDLIDLNPTDRNFISSHRKMISTHRKMNPIDTLVSSDVTTLGLEDAVNRINQEGDMLKNYKTKAGVPNSISLKGNDEGVDASPVPLLKEIEGIKGVPSGGYVVRGEKLYVSYANKLYETQLGDKNKIVHLEIDGKKIKVDTAKKVGSL
jgi:hypothetical protein